MTASEILGPAGIGVVAVAYLPQIVHLRREHCSAGISVRAYSLWCISSSLVLIHAAMIRDVVFTVFQAINLLATATIVILVKRYGRHVCLTHLKALASVESGWSSSHEA